MHEIINIYSNNFLICDFDSNFDLFFIIKPYEHVPNNSQDCSIKLKHVLI